MTATIRCYSMLQQGKVMKVKDLQLRISDLFHGNTKSSIPSQIHLLSTASFTYRTMYEQKNRVVTRRDASKASSQITILKHQLSMDRTRSYEVGRDIITSDLEKKNRTGNQLLSGRSILDMAKKGTANYRKALAFASAKYNLGSYECIEYGTSIEDVFEHVRCEMFYEFQNRKSKNTLVNIVDEEDDEDNEFDATLV